jgi:hypothetical protein
MERIYTRRTLKAVITATSVEEAVCEKNTAANGSAVITAIHTTITTTETKLKIDKGTISKCTKNEYFELQHQ